MEDNDNLLSRYCFLPALTENQNDLFNHVYVPLKNNSDENAVRKINNSFSIPIIDFPATFRTH